MYSKQKASQGRTADVKCLSTSQDGVNSILNYMKSTKPYL